jgi:sugar O-acyltransferase (sialic acid O-acetyltransferase NeuD family)
MRVAVFGSSHQARVVLETLARQNQYAIAGIVDPSRRPGEHVLGCRVLGGDDELPRLVGEGSVDAVVLAIGDNFVRGRVAAKVREISPRLPFATVIHPSAVIASDATIGEGTVIQAGVVVQAGCQIGKHCILVTSSAIDHESVMEDFSSLATSATVGANCRIEAYASMNMRSTLGPRLTVGQHSVVGAGALVLHAVEAFSLTYGVPARHVRRRHAGDPYLAGVGDKGPAA